MQQIPTHFVANLIYVMPRLKNDRRLQFFTDTGGGASMIWLDTVAALGLDVEWVKLAHEQIVQVTALPSFEEGWEIPLPYAPEPIGERFVVWGEKRETSLAKTGVLGRTWFADRIWHFNYPRQTLHLLNNEYDQPTAGRYVTELGFQTDENGKRTTHFPRIQVEVDGRTLDLLLDTGAHAVLAPEVVEQMGGISVVGTSFIIEPIFRHWQAENPNWRIIDEADRTLKMPMIEVPRVVIADCAVGPVWFTMRPEKNFHDYMSQWMDRQVDGALGGSALQYLNFVVDYPNAKVELC